MLIFQPFEAVFEARKRPITLQIVFATDKITNVMEYITFFDFAAYRTLCNRASN